MGTSWVGINPAAIFTNGNWIFSQSGTMSLRRSDLMAIVMGRRKNKENTILPINWERDASKEVLKEFTIVSRTIQHFVNRTQHWSNWRSMHPDGMRRKISPIAFRKTSTLGSKKNWWISLNTSLKIGPMKLRSDFSEALTKLHRLHRESGEVRLTPIPSY